MTCRWLQMQSEWQLMQSEWQLMLWECEWMSAYVTTSERSRNLAQGPGMSQRRIPGPWVVILCASQRPQRGRVSLSTYLTHKNFLILVFLQLYFHINFSYLTHKNFLIIVFTTLLSHQFLLSYHKNFLIITFLQLYFHINFSYLTHKNFLLYPTYLVRQSYFSPILNS